MTERYGGLSLGDRVGCFAAVLLTPVIFLGLFSLFLPDFRPPKGSFVREVLLPTLAAGGTIFWMVRTIVDLFRRSGS
ncbi:hypothetical protein ACFSCW_02740 [Sphingomonas tabacisoli]|uniref:Uncharacterized protein n=1 Tax=Sphingomonas tabacisoli TaxID=2249466 RepID=A0ABW4I0U3_9SPHN